MINTIIFQQISYTIVVIKVYKIKQCLHNKLSDFEIVVSLS